MCVLNQAMYPPHSGQQVVIYGQQQQLPGGPLGNHCNRVSLWQTH